MRIGAYDITAKLGEGGMGEVFRATDTKLRRAVALKVLPPDMARDPERLARFEREARAIAALNHPHIVTIYSVEETDGVHFLTMELLEGQSLADAIPRDGVPIDRLLAAGTALADALAAAHDKGIVHRDLKPANVMFTADGRLKVLDFGLAKEMRAADASDATLTADHTEVGVVMGTPAYMSPEQVAGKTIDHRTDIFSLGVLLYQMASGRRPFAGDTSIELASAILRDTPQPISDLRTDAPSDFVRLIRRCLEKDPQRRVQTARDVGNELREIARAESEPLHARSTAAPALESGGVRTDEGFWVAVQPFKHTSTNADLAALADGLSDEIVIGLSRFSYLHVVTRGPTAVDARYRMDGNVRQAGTKLRLSVQLIDTQTGAHLWAENFERTFSPETMFELQDDLVSRIVSTVADLHGVLPRSMSEAVRSKTPEALTPYEAVLRSFGYMQRVTPEELAAARRALEVALQKAPAYVDAWAMLALLCAQDYGQGFDLQPDSLAQAVAAARRAVECAPSNHLAHFSLAQALFFQREMASFRHAAERTAALNPMDGNSIAFLGELLTYSGDSDRGLALATRAKQLNPHHPGWYWYADFFHAYRQRDYRAALDLALKVNLPSHWGQHVALALAYGQLGERESARKAVQKLLELRPQFAATAQQGLERWWDAEFVQHLLEGLRKAGLDLPPKSESVPSAAVQAPRAPHAGATAADEGFWIAVIPFKCGGANADLAALAEGLSEEIVTGLARFSYLRVISRSSTARFADGNAEVRTVGKELGARYVLEGTVRQAGLQLRVTVQLVDATTGAHLWAETFNRPFDPSELFAIQDNLVPRIVSTVGDAYGVLPHTMSQVVRNKPSAHLTPYEALLRSLSYAERVTAEEHAEAKAALERAVQEMPAHSDCWAMLSIMLADEFGHGFGATRDTLEAALKAARRAVDANPSNHRAYQALAWALFLRKEFPASRQAGERALALNPMDACTAAYVGQTMAYSGDWERGCGLITRAIELNPHHPGWYWYALFLDAYRKRDFTGALALALKLNLPGVSLAEVALAASFAQVGDFASARNALNELRLLIPEYGAIARKELGKWFDAEITGLLLEGLRKAGLDVGSGSQSAVNSSASQNQASAMSTAPAIAVLPFANLSTDKEQEYFSDGLAEEIINLLTHVPGLKVIARTSAFAFRGKDEDVRKIAQALDVTHVLQGSVRRAGERVRVTTQLIAAIDGGHVWSERYDRELSDIFAVQDEIAAAISGALRVKLSSASATVAQRYQPKVAAYEAYLKAKHHMAKVTPDALELARECYESAIAIDPGYGLAHVGIGFYQLVQTMFGRLSPAEGIPAITSAVQRALQCEGSMPEAHALLGYVAASFERDFAAAERHFEYPGAKQVGYALTRPLYGGYLFAKGDADGAIAVATRAIQEDPLEVWPRMNLHAYLQAAGRDREAYEQAMKAIELDANLVIALVSIAHFHAHWDEWPAAVAAARRTFAVGPWYPDAVATLAAVLHRTGEVDEARALYQSVGRGERAGDVRAQAVYYLLVGDMDTAADYVERALAERDHSIMYYLRFVIARPLKQSPRWSKIARMMGQPA